MSIPVILLLLPLTAEVESTSRTATLTIDHCLVSLIDDVEVPAREAGVLRAVRVKPGQAIQCGDLLAGVDDEQPRSQLRLAEIKQLQTRERAENDINVRYAKAAEAVAEAQHEMILQANKRSTGAVSESEVRKHELEHHRAELAVDQAIAEQQQARREHELAGAEVAAAEVGIARRQIVAPLGGMVVDVRRQAGEWVNPGETVIRIAGLDRLRVEGFVSVRECDPAQLAGCPVEVVATLDGDRLVRCRGKVVFVDPLVIGGGKFRVRAEINNVGVNGNWLLRPGLTVRLALFPPETPEQAAAAATQQRPAKARR